MSGPGRDWWLLSNLFIHPVVRHRGQVLYLNPDGEVLDSSG